MAKIFFPNTKYVEYIKASKPHPINTQYKISIGLEHWDDESYEVLKVQMIYNGKISGRRSPSYPVGTDDFENVNKKAKELLDRYKKGM